MSLSLCFCTNEKNVLQKETKDWAFENWWSQLVGDLCWFLKFFNIISMTCVSKEYEIKTKNGTGAMTTAKNDILIFLLGWIDFWKILNFTNWFLYTMKKLRAHHIHHVPKWPSYFCKILALCVSQIYMVYIHDIYIYIYIYSLVSSVFVTQ